jgi:Dolichyl-phosphate-mannose-protein mannosyltransferase
MAAARGGMWTDEAWSVVFAARARDPLGIFLRINHDNNHHLNSLWLQAIGMHAPSMLARAPAILAGTLAIPAAASLFARRSTAGAIAAAALFAISPIMVTYGSEARGYATMILATIIMIWLVTNSVEGRAKSGTRWLIALTAALGVLSHLTMLAPVVLLTLWVYLEKRSSTDVPRAMSDTLALMAPACLACAAMLLVTVLPAILSPTGLQTGGYNPFSYGNYVVGLSNMESWTAGLVFPERPIALVALFGVGVALLVWPPVVMGSRARLCGVLIVGVPLVIFVERIGNAQFARFYLSAAIGLLLLGAEWIALAVKSDRTQRALCATASVLFVITAIWHDGELIELGRGQPERAIRLMAQDAPRGASVDIKSHQIAAPIAVAAYQADYPLAVAKSCGHADFMVVQRDADSPRSVLRCGRQMDAIAWSEATDLTGDAWVLYRAEALPGT